MKAGAIVAIGFVLGIISISVVSALFLNAPSNAIISHTIETFSSTTTKLSSIGITSTTSSNTTSQTTTSLAKSTQSSNYSISPSYQTTTNGHINITACISVSTTMLFYVYLIDPNGTITFQQQSISPSTANNFTLSNGTWCKVYTFTLTSFGNWVVQVGFSSYAADATIYYGTNPMQLEYSISPSSQTVTDGKANVTACIAVPTTEFFNVNLIAPNGTVIFVDSMSPNTVTNFTISDNTWCKSYSLTLTALGTWTVHVGFELGPTYPQGLTANATIDYQQSVS